ncbi:MAG: right-handed parallel beta-helix repeat-containing protein [Rhodospirillaceae bacterium]|nr:right-handed parallel beta-helix repeat-containing protein [Rhodospirillaceae bacterium]
MLQFKKFLSYSGCTVALVSGLMGTSYAQVGSTLGLQGVSETSGGGFGLNGSAWIPLAHGLGILAEGGNQDKNPFGSLGLSYRFMAGPQLGLGIFSTLDIQESSHKNTFYGTTLGFEAGLGALTVRSNLYIPLGDHKKEIKNSGHSDGVFVNQPGTNTCTNPNNTNNRVCDLHLRTYANSIEKTYFRFDASTEYVLNLGKFRLVPSAGIYVDDRPGKALVGFQGEMGVAFNITDSMMLKASGGFRHDREEKTRGVFSVGLSWQFGGTIAHSTPAFMASAPKHLQRRNRPYVSQGKSFDEQAILQDNTSGIAVQQVQFVDASNEGLIIGKINAMAANTMVIVNGTVRLPGNNPIIFGNDHVAVVGGGASVHLRGASSGQQGIFHVPGDQGRIIQPGTNDLFNIFNNRNNIMLQGLHLDGNGTARSAIFANNNADELRLRDLTIDNLQDAGIIIANTSDNAILSNISINRGGQVRAIAIESGSTNATVEHIYIQNAGGDGIGIAGANGTVLNDIHIDTAGDDGIDIANSANVTVTGADIRNVANDGIEVFGPTTQTITLQDVQVHNSQGHGIHILASADNVTLRNILVVGNNTAMRRGVNVSPGSMNIALENVHAQNWQIGFEIFGTGLNPSSVTDVGGNRFTPGAAGQTACDGMPDAGGSLQIQVTGSGVVTCN